MQWRIKAGIHWTMTMQQIRIVHTLEEKQEIFTRMVKSNLHKIVLYSLEEPTLEDWLEQLEKAWCFGYYIDKEMIGMGWFNMQQGKTTFSHYFMYPEYAHLAQKRITEVLDYVAEKLDVSVYMGLTPIVYRHSRNLMTGLGFKAIAKLPSACFMAQYNKFTDGILYMRENYGYGTAS